MSRETPTHYVSGKELFEEMVRYKETCKNAEASGLARPPITDTIASSIVRISNKLATTWNFSGYTYKSEMISDGILKCVEKIHLFDPTRGENVFAYATQIIFNAFVGRIKSEQHQSSVKAKLIREKMSSEFVQHGVDSDADDGGNSFVEFLKSNDAYQDYHMIRADKLKAKVPEAFRHKNKTAYKTKDVIVIEEIIFNDLTEFESV